MELQETNFKYESELGEMKGCYKSLSRELERMSVKLNQSEKQKESLREENEQLTSDIQYFQLISMEKEEASPKGQTRRSKRHSIKPRTSSNISMMNMYNNTMVGRLYRF